MKGILDIVILNKVKLIKKFIFETKKENDVIYIYIYIGKSSEVTCD